MTTWKVLVPGATGARNTSPPSAADRLPGDGGEPAVDDPRQRHGHAAAGRDRTAGLLLAGAGAVSLAVALAAVLRRYDQTEPGDALACGLGATLLGVLLLDPPPHAVRLFPNDDGWTASTVLWSVLTLAAAGLTTIGSQDPFLHHRRQRSPGRPGNSADSPALTSTTRGLRGRNS